MHGSVSLLAIKETVAGADDLTSPQKSHLATFSDPEAKVLPTRPTTLRHTDQTPPSPNR
jgi:hypothetical protein